MTKEASPRDDKLFSGNLLGLGLDFYSGIRLEAFSWMTGVKSIWLADWPKCRVQ